ncbi:hypothetical protein [Singulisphaera sp. PoT]|uniref:hypothetical protein n=1 Tax=Singulisphaera sp. PoT TaxID=3411797 RepID=UPI003BF613DC
MQGRKLKVLGLVAILWAVPWCVGHGQDAKKATITAFPDSPEGAVKNFMIAMATGNERELQALTLPLPEGDFAWLLKGERLPADKVAEFRKAVAEEMPFRIAKPGEMFPLSKGRVIEIKPAEFSPDRSVVVHEGAPIPTRVRKIEGRWKVDAAPMVAGRKAAFAARQRAEEAAAKAKASPKVKP